MREKFDSVKHTLTMYLSTVDFILSCKEKNVKFVHHQNKNNHES